jgi:hypothetical protein
MRSLSAILLVCACAPAAGGEFLEQLRAEDYRAFARAPGWETPLSPAAGGPHGDFLDMYVDDTVSEAVAAAVPLTAWPDGSLIVKDAWADAEGEDLRFVAAMEKRDGRWFWAEYRGNDDVVVESFDAPQCTGCHDEGDDGVLAFALP